MNRLDAMGMATKLAAAFPRFPIGDATVEWWGEDFARYQGEVVVEAVSILVTGVDHAPAVAEVREALRVAHLSVTRGVVVPFLPSVPTEGEFAHGMPAAVKAQWEAIKAQPTPDFLKPLLSDEPLGPMREHRKDNPRIPRGAICGGKAPVERKGKWVCPDCGVEAMP